MVHHPWPHGLLLRHAPELKPLDDEEAQQPNERQREPDRADCQSLPGALNPASLISGRRYPHMGGPARGRLDSRASAIGSASRARRTLGDGSAAHYRLVNCSQPPICHQCQIRPGPVALKVKTPGSSPNPSPGTCPQVSTAIGDISGLRDTQGGPELTDASLRSGGGIGPPLPLESTNGRRLSRPGCLRGVGESGGVERARFLWMGSGGVGVVRSGGRSGRRGF